MTIEFHCPNCGKVLKTADDKAGVRAKCPGCGEAVTVPDSSEFEAAQYEETGAVEQAAAAGAAGGFDDNGGFGAPPPIPAAGDTKTCPMCGATIKAAASKCRFCGEMLVTTTTGAPSRIEAGDIIDRAWNIFKDQMGLAVAGSLIVMLFFGGMGVAAYAVLVGLAIALGGAGQPGMRGDPDTVGIVMSIGMFGMMTMFLVASAFINAGQHIFFLKIATGKQATIGDLFAGGHYFWRTVGANFLFTLLVTIGLIFCIVPGVMLILMFWPFGYVIVDRNAGAIDALRISRELTAGNLLSIFVLGLAAWGIQMLGNLACYIGLLFTTPFVFLMFAVAYCAMSGQPTAERKPL